MIKEIKEALEKIALGPWIVTPDGYSVYSTLPGVPDCSDRMICVTAHNARERSRERRAEANAAFIASAPRYIRFLLDRLEALEKEQP